VVASRLAVEGLDVEDGKQILLAESDEQFADTVVDLLNNPEQRAALATRASSWARANLGWERSIAAYEALYESLMQQSGIP
jgi:glycosyltransferase involved in cell wall biosynthesis